MKFEYLGGMVGNPILPEVEWNDTQMKILKDMGLNCAQLNIAWDNRPENEPLNLEHIDSDMIIKLRHRVNQLKKFGLKGILHLGMPKIKVLMHDANITPYLTPSCILEDNTLKENVKMIINIMKELPEVEDYMFYTYDQHAWLCSEFGICPNCAGVPLDQRLPEFINNIKKEMQKVNNNVKFWWQPWELSLGQIIEVLRKIDTNNFGLMLNTAGSESYYNNLENYWIKCISYIMEERNIPFIAEIQTSGSGVGTVPLQCFPCPTLVYRQINIVNKMPTCVGIKEHFGYAFSKISCNMLFLKEYLKNPELALNEILRRTALCYGEKAVPFLIESWNNVEKATDFIPFSFTYLYTNIAGMSPKHGFDVPMPDAVHADTPAWESDRRAYYLITHDMEYHPWALEDTALRFKNAGERFRKSLNLLKKALEVAQFRVEDLSEQISDVDSMTKACFGQYYYFKEALLAFDVRTAIFQRDNNKLEILLIKFDEIMKMDVINQDNDDLIVEKYNEFKNDKLMFFEKNFKQDERYWAKSYVQKIDQRY